MDYHPLVWLMLQCLNSRSERSVNTTSRRSGKADVEDNQLISHGPIVIPPVKIVAINAINHS